MQNPMQMIQMFNQFRNEITPEGAFQKVQELLRTGQMNQQKLNQLQAAASQFQQMFNIR